MLLYYPTLLLYYCIFSLVHTSIGKKECFFRPRWSKPLQAVSNDMPKIILRFSLNLHKNIALKPSFKNLDFTISISLVYVVQLLSCLIKSQVIDIYISRRIMDPYCLKTCCTDRTMNEEEKIWGSRTLVEKG